MLVKSRKIQIAAGVIILLIPLLIWWINVKDRPFATSGSSSSALNETAREENAKKVMSYLDEAVAIATRIGSNLRGDALVKVARAKMAAGDVSGGSKLLQDAKRAARNLPNGFQKTELLKSIVEVETSAGMFDDADKTFRQFTTANSDSFDILQTLCDGLAKADRSTAALMWLVTAQKEASLSDVRPDVEARIWIAIARSQLKAQDAERASKSLKSAATASLEVGEPSTQVFLWCDIARLYAAMKNAQEATAIVLRALERARAADKGNQGSRADLLATVAAAQAEIGDASGSQSTFRDAIEASATIANGARRVVVLRDAARLQLGAGDKGGADATIRLASGIVNADPAEAVQNDAHAITTGTWRGVAAAVVARALAETGKFDDALKMARSIQGYQKACALADVAREEAKAGKFGEATTTVREAQEAAELSRQDTDKAAALVSIGLAQITLDDYDGATKTAKAVEAIEPYLSIQIYITAAGRTASR